MKKVLTHILILFTFQINAQIYYVEDTTENTNYFDCVGPCFLSCENQGMTYTLWNNNIIKRMEIHHLDSTINNQILVKFYPSGQISLFVRDYSLVYHNTDSFEYIVPTGYFQTYYPNGQLRSSYYVDKAGSYAGKYLFYQKNGRILFENEYKDGHLYNGIQLTQNWTELNKVKYQEFKGGVLIKDYDICIREKKVLLKMFGKRKYQKLALIIENFIVQDCLMFY